MTIKDDDLNKVICTFLYAVHSVLIMSHGTTGHSESFKTAIYDHSKYRPCLVIYFQALKM